MNFKTGTETPIFLFWEYLFQNFGILSLQCSSQNTHMKVVNTRKGGEWRYLTDILQLDDYADLLLSILVDFSPGHFTGFSGRYNRVHL